MKADAIKLARIEHRAVRVVILEGIFIFRREYADRLLAALDARGKVGD